MAEPRRLIGLAGSVLERVGPLPDGPCVVALSGGADSAVCGWTLQQKGVRCRGVFVHHGLPASDALQEAAAAIAHRLAMGFEAVPLQIPPASSWESVARTARYQALEGSLAVDETLVTGHTADDQAETVLANLVRGAGLRGLGGIPRSRPRLLRPLLDVWRRETRELATLLDLPWRDDPDNLDPRGTRNALRLSLIPDIEDRHNPGFREALVRLARRVSQDDELLEAMASRVPIEAGPVRIPSAWVRLLPSPLASRVARRALRMAHPPYPGTEEDVERILAVAKGAAPRDQVAGGWEVRREGPWVILTRGEKPEPPRPVAWNLIGETHFGPWRLEGWIENRPPEAFPLSAWTVVFDADRVPTGVEVRRPASEDHIAINAGHKQVRRALAEAGVPNRERDSWPVLASGSAVLWIPGVRSSQADWVTLTTRRYLWLQAERRAGE